VHPLSIRNPLAGGFSPAREAEMDVTAALGAKSGAGVIGLGGGNWQSPLLFLAVLFDFDKPSGVSVGGRDDLSGQKGSTHGSMPSADGRKEMIRTSRLIEEDLRSSDR
jgi:hypothetical protein